MRLLPLLIVAVLPSAALAADELVLSPDRPGVGESPGTPGVGAFNVESAATLTFVEGDVHPGLQGTRIRVGIAENVELRAVVPDVVFQRSEVVLGPIGAGAKIAARASDRFSLSVVPELLITFDGEAGWRVSANGGFEEGKVTLWLNATTTVFDSDLHVFGGGGASVAIDSGGIYINAGREVVYRDTLVGGGGWWRLRSNLQVDAGIDLWLDGPDIIAVPQIGCSIAF